jgi:hypothetical protein
MNVEYDSTNEDEEFNKLLNSNVNHHFKNC